MADKHKQHCHIWIDAEGWSVGTNDSDEYVAASSRGKLLACPSAILPTLSPRTQQMFIITAVRTPDLTETRNDS